MTSTEFVNHASYIIEFNGKKIITDPWLEYRVFNEGWQLLSDSKCTYEKFKDIDYIWFSHEHPDHFMPRVIKKIPKSYKSNIKWSQYESYEFVYAYSCRIRGYTREI